VLAVDVSEKDLEGVPGAGGWDGPVQISMMRWRMTIDMVDVSTPNHLHEEQGGGGASGGKHVLLQKPMANTLAAADHIVAAAGRSKGKLGMYMSSYNNPLVWEVKKLIEGGTWGRFNQCGRATRIAGGCGRRRRRRIGAGIGAAPGAGRLFSFRFMG